MNLPAYIKEIRQKGQRYFTVEQFMSDLNLSKNAALNAISRIKEHGDLISPARGLYVIVPPEHQPYGCIPAEDLVPILMKYLQTDYYVSLLSAALFHGASHQKPAKFQIITSKRINHPLEFGQVKLELVYKKLLADVPTQNFTVSTGYLKVATPEQVAIDLLNYPNRSGGLNHVATVLSELVESMDENKLISLADKTPEKYQLQRLGYILEKIETMDDDKTNRIIAKLEEYLTNKLKAYVPLAAELPKAGYPRVKKWKIIENTDIESDL
ncbi:MAG: type IV toxin-antitoxin system AbiEi family antitoxin [Gammaproteobacteria bacterium]|jgi:predicted transcriptional regulator of viral defense system|nr:type IV toxin-antitoxin system AbiEi family antitoxin [Gammaproteobacteria bacterium]